MQKITQREFKEKKAINKKSDKLHVKRKGYDYSFNSWVDDKYIIQKSYFPEPDSYGKKKIKVELYLPNYANNIWSKKSNRSLYIKFC